MGANMKRQGHKHKESFSILLLSNTGRGNRQFHISQSVFYVMVSLLLAVLIGYYLRYYSRFLYLFLVKQRRATSRNSIIIHPLQLVARNS